VQLVHHSDAGKIHLADGVDHKPRPMIRRQPLSNVQRQQETLLTPAFQ
jgi:hypothetical protein